MNRMLVVLGVIAVAIVTATGASAQTAITSDQSSFAFQLERTNSRRGVGVAGYVENALPWRITNVRVQVDIIDASGTLVASASGWVLGDVAAGGRGYFYAPISTPGATYRASVQAFDRVMPAASAPQAP